MSSGAGLEVLIADVLLVEALVMERLALVLIVERLALVLVMTGLLKSRRGPTGPLAAELMVLSGRPKPIRWSGLYHESSILITPSTSGFFIACSRILHICTL